MLKQRGCYTIELSDGRKIPLRFCTWTFVRFCELNNNLSFFELEAKLNTLSLPEFVQLMLCAAEYEFDVKDEVMPYKKRDVSDWIDDIGGLASPAFLAMVKTIKDSFSDGSTANGQAKKKSVTNV